MTKKVGFLPLLLVLCVSCSEHDNRKVSIRASNVKEDRDSLMVDSLFKKQQFVLAITKIDSVLPLKPSSQKGYYYIQKGFNSLMLEHHNEAIFNFEQAVSLGYKIEESTIMIETAKKMKQTHEQYN